jgi:AbrB family looped-hinge helix DNA binding protein
MIPRPDICCGWCPFIPLLTLDEDVDMRGRARINQQRQIVIPAECRAAAGLKPGDELIVEAIGEGELRLRTPEQATKAAQQIVARYSSGRDLVAELIAERREEAARGGGSGMGRELVRQLVAEACLTRPPIDAGFFETEHHAQVARDLQAAITRGGLIALTAVIGSGKTILARRLRAELERENNVIVSRSPSLDKAKNRDASASGCPVLRSLAREERGDLEQFRTARTRSPGIVPAGQEARGTVR